MPTPPYKSIESTVDSPQISKLESALQWSQRGFRVFPLIENSKFPLFEGWTESATTDPAKIESWWVCPVSNTEFDYNIGCLTTGLAVLDVDVKDGKHGLASFEGLGIDPTSLMVRTASGGFHLYYSGASAKTRIEFLGPGSGVDLKGYNSYVLAPGSTIDGRSYTLENDAPVEFIPEVLDPFILPPRARGERQELEFADDSLQSIADAAFYLRNNAPLAVEGQGGNTTTYRVCAKLTRDYGLSEGRALELLLEHWNHRCSPPWDEGDLEDLVAHGSRYGAGEVGTATSEAMFGEIKGFDHTLTGEDAAAAGDEVKSAESSSWRDNPGYFKVILPGELSERVRRVSPALIEGYLDAVGTSLFYGASQTWKTFSVVDMCDRVAAGEPWAGRKTQQGLCVIIAAESVVSVVQRVEAVRRARERDGNHPVVIMEEHPNLFAGRGGDAGDVKRITRTLEALIQHFGVPLRMVVLDTFSKGTIGCDGNSEKDVALIEKRCDGIAQALQCQFAVIHHSGKNPDRGAKGSSTFDQNFPAVLGFRRVFDDDGNDVRIIVHAKAKDRELQPDIRLSISNVGIGDDAAGKPISMGVVTAAWPAEEGDGHSFELYGLARILSAVAGGGLRTQRGIARATGVPLTMVNKHLKSAEGEGCFRMDGGAYQLTPKGREALNEAQGFGGTQLDDPPDVKPDMDAVKAKFMEIEDQRSGDRRALSERPKSEDYAPKVCQGHPFNKETGFTVQDFKEAMELLFIEGELERENGGATPFIVGTRRKPRRPAISQDWH